MNVLVVGNNLFIRFCILRGFFYDNVFRVVQECFLDFVFCFCDFSYIFLALKEQCVVWILLNRDLEGGLKGVVSGGLFYFFCLSILYLFDF